MPRQNRRRDRDETSVPGVFGSMAEWREEFRAEQYVVRSVSGSVATKAYRCPGCDQEVRVGVPHVVAWPAHDAEATDRRHWHTACWGARDRRLPGVQRGRSAPRY